MVITLRRVNIKNITRSSFRYQFQAILDEFIIFDMGLCIDATHARGKVLRAFMRMM